MMKVYKVVGKDKFFSTLEKAQKYVLSLGMVERVAIGKGYDKKVYTKKFYPSRIDFTDYVFYDCLKTGMSYTDWLMKNKCLECGTTIYLKDKPPVEIEEIEVE